jgi:hypothetical protein|tara:strand:- start:829 stop:1017 length:189 start_codon:yes stop_codon:yes gene_type:complete
VVYSDERNDRFSRIDGSDCGTGDVVAKTTKFRGGFGLLGFVLFFITSDHSSERRTKSTTHQQ